MSPAKTAQPIEIPFGLETQVGPRNHVLDVSRSRMGRGNFEGEGWPVVNYRDSLSRAVQKPVEMPFLTWTSVG